MWIEQSQRNRAAKCHQEGIPDQLKEGMRYLNIRVVNEEDFVNGTGTAYPLVHGFIADDPVNTLEKALDTIVGFLNANPGEFVIARTCLQ
jgi:hypothetical protein